MKIDTMIHQTVEQGNCARTAGKMLGMGALLASGLLAAGMAWANPIDPVSNPQRLSYPDIHMLMSDYDEPFQRDGVVIEPARFHQMTQGMSADQVVALIGQPLNANASTKEPDNQWDYNIVCQYKVVFDQDQKLENGYWRRHQCLDIVNGAAAR